MSATSLARAGSGAVAGALAHHRRRLPVPAGAQRMLSAALSTTSRALQQQAPSQQPGTPSVVEQFFADAERKRGVRVCNGRRRSDARGRCSGCSCAVHARVITAGRACDLTRLPRSPTPLAPLAACLQVQHRTEPPVPLAPGEVLLYEAGLSTAKTVIGSSFGVVVMWAYVALNAKLTLSTPDLALLSRGALAGFTGFAGVGSLFFAGTARAAVRYAVLTADGLHVRLYPYASSWGPVLGLGAKPVTVPVRLLSVAERTAAAGATAGATTGGKGVVGGRSDNASIYVAVRGCAANLAFDKPAALLPWVGGPGTGLMMTERGVEGTLPDPSGTAAAALAVGGGAASGSSSVIRPSQLYALPPGDRDALRRYALLLHVLSGHTVEPARLRSQPAAATTGDNGEGEAAAAAAPAAPALDAAGGSWELEEMTVQLDPSGSSAALLPAAAGSGVAAGSRRGRAADARITELRYWRRTTDPDSGREYWWHTLTGASQWSPPVLEGRTPYEWHPDLAAGDGRSTAPGAVPT
jgi:hypothetical protein